MKYPVFLILLLFSSLLASCKERETPRLDNTEQKKTVAKIETSAKKEAGDKKLDQKDAVKAQKTKPEIRFVFSNLYNYLVSNRYVKGKRVKSSPKPKEEVEALCSLFADLKPDVLGVCEIGDEEILRSFQKELKKRGLDLPHIEHHNGTDAVRHLALLSKYPIIKRNSKSNLGYKLDGKHYNVRRGILDITVDTGVEEVRFLGVHLKSKRPVKFADQKEIRMNEAHIFRDHLEEILKESPDELFLAFGDFNDTFDSSPIKKMRGRRNGALYMKELPLVDSRGDYWTHFWKKEHIYSRFDYVFPSPKAAERVFLEKSCVVDDKRVLEGTDHRPLLVVLK